MARGEQSWEHWLDALWSDPFDEPPFTRTELTDLNAFRGGDLLHSANALAYYTPRLATTYLRAAPEVARHLDGEAYLAWANAGQTLAPRHWELCLEYYRVSPRVVPMLGSGLAAWMAACRKLAQVYMPLGVSAMRHSPSFLHAAGSKHVDAWIAGALRLAEEATGGAQVCQPYVGNAAPVIARLPQENVREWLDELIRLSADSSNIACQVLDTDWAWFADLATESASATVRIGERCRSVSAIYAKQWWETAADAMPALPPEVGEGLIALAERVAARSPDTTRELIAHSPGVFSQLAAGHHLTLLKLIEELAEHDASLVVEFMTTSGDLCDLLTADDLRRWFYEGIALLETNPEAAVAWFRQESQASAQRLMELRQVVHLEVVAPILQRYAEALCDRKLHLKGVHELPYDVRNLGRNLPTTDGQTIFLPNSVERHGSYDSNFREYKIASSHQSGYFEFGTFGFSLRDLEDDADFAKLMESAQSRGRLRPVLTDFERFFSLFANPELAQHLFVAAEDARIDHRLQAKYAGLRVPITEAAQDALAHRPSLERLPLRMAAVEYVVRLSLARLDLPPAPLFPEAVDRLLRGAMRPLLDPASGVVDSARAAMRMYTVIVRLPNATEIEQERVTAIAGDTPDGFAEPETEGESATFFPDAGEGELPYGPPEDIAYRGDLRAEEVQKKSTVRALQDALHERAEEGSPISSELLKQLLEMGININIKKLDISQLLETSDLFLHDIDDRPGLPDVQEELDLLTEDERTEIRDRIDDLAADVLDDPLPAERVFYYDEWDSDIDDYRHRWCRVKEVMPEPGESGAIGRVAREYADLIRNVRQQFQMVKPEQLRKIKRLEDGEEVELNDAIAAIIDRRSGRTPDDKIYEQRERYERDVATLFLIDVSASTDEWVEEAGEEEEDAVQPTETGETSGVDALASLLDRDAISGRGFDDMDVSVAAEKRIIDIERDAVVIMAEALQGLGDSYAIYGFSGFGRENVDLFPVKAFDEQYGERVKARLAGLEPHKSTRMGPAVRHAMALLSEQPAKVRTLILISDGYPQDVDYGKDRTGKTYGLNDTMVALQEARQAGIVAFCLTIDQAGHDYLRQMCGGRDYLVIEDIRALPTELPKVYRGLTT